MDKQYDRIYKCTKLSTQHNIDYVRDLVKRYKNALDLLRPLAIYIKNLNDPSEANKKKLVEYNFITDFIKTEKIEKIDMNNKDKYESSISQISKLLDLGKDELVEFIKKIDYRMLEDLDQVAWEQLYAVSTDEIYPELYYLEIYGKNDRIISMFVSNFKDYKVQMHYYITVDLRNLIKKTEILKRSSIFMHSFASSLFGNDYWYTDPIGKMDKILEEILHPESLGRTQEDKKRELSKLMDERIRRFTRHGLTVNPVYQCKIGNFLMDCWKTKSLADGKEQLNTIYDPEIIVNDENELQYGFVYGMQGGGYYQKYLKYKSKYLRLKRY